mmetsp:Transcript_130920/g.407136  ORF Transcript_130920/g.407136 Transcript_130920/m.407136 type:complete len:587 (-) Transcript_130920:163-1923(-)
MACSTLVELESDALARMLDSGHQDLDPAWGLLAGVVAGSSSEVDDAGGEWDSCTSVPPVETLVPPEYTYADSSSEHEGNGGMELSVSISSMGSLDTLCLEHFPVHLSSSNEASVRCMMALHPSSELQAWLHDGDRRLLCETGPVPRHDDGWVCLNHMTTAGGGVLQSSRLVSCMRDCADGWSVCFDVKERAGDKAVLRFVRLVRCSAREAHEVAGEERCQASADRSGSREPAIRDVLDCTDAEASGELAVRSFGMFARMGPRCSMRDMLRGMALTGEGGLPPRLLRPIFWRAMSQGAGVQEAHDVRRASPDMAVGKLEQARFQLESKGFCQFRDMAWEEIGISLQAVVATMDSLRDNGFPPVFIFMFDEPWLIFAKLLGTMAGILASKTMEMDTSIFAWALQLVDKCIDVGSNFGRPHRDCSYDDCHSANGDMTLVTVWLPVVPVTIDSGCIYVVPADRDPLFARSDDPLHMTADQQVPWPHIRPLPCAAGDVLMWQGSLIHWGSACSESAGQPRKSIGTAFVLPCESSRAVSSKTDTLSKEELEGGLSMQARLQFVLKALLRYEHWHPGFGGVSGLDGPDNTEGP